MGGPSGAAFRITNARRLDKNSLIGAFDLHMPSGLILRGVMLLESHGKRWIGLPSREWLKEDGGKGYAPIIEFASRDVAERFQALVLPLAERALDFPS